MTHSGQTGYLIITLSLGLSYRYYQIMNSFQLTDRGFLMFHIPQKCTQNLLPLYTLDNQYSVVRSPVAMRSRWGGGGACDIMCNRSSPHSCRSSRQTLIWQSSYMSANHIHSHCGEATCYSYCSAVMYHYVNSI